MSRSTLYLVACVLFVGGFLNDQPWSSFYRRYSPPPAEAQRVALSIARDGTFANPFGPQPTGPTAHVAPAYPFLVGTLIRVFGEGPDVWFGARMVVTAALSLQFALLPWAARMLGFSPWTGAIAAVFGIIMKPLKEERWEMHLAGLLILLLTVAMVKRWKGIGALAGVSFLVQPALAPVYFVWAAWRRQVLLIVVPLLICLPWIVRNYVVLGQVSWLRSNLGLELAVSFNDCTPYGVRLSEAIGCFTETHPNASAAQAKAVAELGEKEYNSRRMKEALGWIAAHPGTSLKLIVERAWFFWFPSDNGWELYRHQPGRMLTGHLFTAMSFVGLWLAWKRRLPGIPYMSLWLAVFPLIYYIMQFEERYRYPVLWITWLLAAYLLEPLYSSKPERRKAHEERDKTWVPKGKQRRGGRRVGNQPA